MELRFEIPDSICQRMKCTWEFILNAIKSAIQQHPTLATTGGAQIICAPNNVPWYVFCKFTDAECSVVEAIPVPMSESGKRLGDLLLELCRVHVMPGRRSAVPSRAKIKAYEQALRNLYMSSLFYVGWWPIPAKEYRTLLQHGFSQLEKHAEAYERQQHPGPTYEIEHALYTVHSVLCEIAAMQSIAA